MKAIYRLMVLVVFITCVGIHVHAQDIGEIAFINNLGDKEVATYSHAITMYALVLRGKSFGARVDSSLLEKQGIIEKNEYKGDDLLRRGMLANMIARHLSLKDSVMYSIFKSERYAYRACISAGIMEPPGSERDILSGEELIEIMSEVEKVSGGSK